MHGKTMREALNEVRSFRDATNEGGPGSGPQKSYKTIPKNETESEKDIRLDKATAVAKAANDKRISDAIKKMQKQDEKQKKKDETVEEAKFTPTQVSALQKAYGQVGPGGEKNAMRMNQLAKMMGKYSKDHLSQLANLDIPMVSRVAKELMK